MLDLDPENGRAHLNLAKALIQLDDPEGAIEHLQEATSIEVTLADARPDLIQAHFNAGAAAFNGEDMPRAIANYRRVCELVPDDVEARRHLAVALARAGQVDAALIEAARLDPLGQNDPDVQYDIGIVLLVAGQVGGARDRLQRALALRPDWDDARRHLDALP